MNAAELKQSIHYPNFPEFEQFGIDLSLTEADLILALQKVRNLSGIPITPSPLQGAWSRTSGSETSRHYAVNRKSDAGDVFPRRGRGTEVWLTAQQVPEINGFGLYLDKRGTDGKPWIMFHLDLRTRPRRFWVTDKLGNYWTLLNNPVQFKRTLAEILTIDLSGGHYALP